MGIVKRMPRSVQEAWNMLSEDTALVSELGDDFVTKYIAVKEVKDRDVHWANGSVRGEIHWGLGWAGKEEVDD